MVMRRFRPVNPEIDHFEQLFHFSNGFTAGDS